MSKISDAELAKWAEIREKGKWKYIFDYGLLRFGLSMLIFFLTYIWLFQPNIFGLPLILVSALIFPVAGIAWGRWMWFYLEKLHSKMLKTHEGEINNDER